MSTTLTILDVGHGASTIIQDENTISLVDTGESSALIDYLDSKKITHINYLFLSHADSDHIRKALQLLTSQKYTVNNIVLNSDSEKDSKIWKDLAYEIEQQSNKNEIKPIIGVKSKDTFTLGKNLLLRVVSPSPEICIIGAGGNTKNGEIVTANTVSLFAVIMKNDKNMVSLTGDIDEIAINHFSEEIKENLNCKFLVFPHHGGLCNDLNAYKNLLSYTKPDFIIFSNGKKFPNPRKEIISIIKSTLPKSNILCTEISQFCRTCETSNKCAGDITIDIDSSLITQPNFDDYKKMKELFSSKIC